MAKSTTDNLSIQPVRTTRTRVGQKKSLNVEGEVPPTAPAQVPAALKKRGRKPKHAMTVADDLPSQEGATSDDPGAANQPAGDTVTSTGAMTKKSTAIMHDPLPV